METTQHDAVQTIRLLDCDPDLGRTLRPERRAEARASAHATAIEIGRGGHALRELVGGHPGVYGALLLGGLVNRTVVLHDVVAAELLGPGDLVRASVGADALVETTVRWTVLEPLSLALLDERFLLTVRRWPEIVAALFERLAAQEDRRAVHRALSQLPRVEDRVHALLWLLAERWGQVTPQGIVLRLRLTHELIGQLVGAKRPTVSLALKQLEAHGTVHRRADGAWLLERRRSGPAASDGAFASDGAALLDGAPGLGQPPPPARLTADDASSVQFPVCHPGEREARRTDPIPPLPGIVSPVLRRSPSAGGPVPPALPRRR